MSAATPIVNLHNNQDKSSSKNGEELMTEFVANEFVFAVVGPVGAGTSMIATQLQAILKTNDIDTEIIKASEAILTWVKENENNYTDPEIKLDKATALQNAGDKLRTTQKGNAAVAIKMIEKIKSLRAHKNSVGSGVDIPTKPSPRAYILDSLKNPGETSLLRQVYQDAFCQIGVVCSENIRKERLASGKYRKSSKEEVESFMKRDENDSQSHGQKVSATFHLSDFFVNNTPSRMLDQGGGTEKANPEWDVADQLTRLVNILIHPQQKVIRPKASETGMFHAFGAQMRSACLSRQVGAALMDGTGNIISTGTNEVPRAGGGVYGGGFRIDIVNEDEYDHRCSVTHKKCKNTESQNEIIEQILNEIPELKDIPDVGGIKIFDRLKKTPIGQLLEFSRAVHAEMDALLSAARQGATTIGTRLFVTTFPCHYCARHIITAGVDEVQFIEPYLKSKAFSLHGDAIKPTPEGWIAPSKLTNNSEGERNVLKAPPQVLFRPFTGVAPRLYRRAFLKDRDLKNNQTGNMEVGKSDASIRPELLRFSYLEVETKLVDTGESS